MANAARLEVDFTFDGKDYAVRPTFEIISSIEQVTGKSCTALAKKFWADEPENYASLTETSQVMYQVLRGADKDITAARIAGVFMTDGYVQHFTPLYLFCSRALRGHKEHQRMAEEQGKRREREAANGGAENPPEDSDQVTGG